MTMTLSYYPGRAFKGKVAYIYPYLEAKTRTVKVRLEFDNRNLELKPDMYANVLIDSLVADNRISVPSEAVIRSGERNVVITAIGEGKFLPKDVRLGVESGDGYYEVLHGLKAGEKVVTSAHFLIDSESRLKEAINKMLEEKKEKESVHSDMDMSDMTVDDDMDMSGMTLEKM